MHAWLEHKNLVEFLCCLYLALAWEWKSVFQEWRDRKTGKSGKRPVGRDLSTIYYSAGWKNDTPFLKWKTLESAGAQLIQPDLQKATFIRNGLSFRAIYGGKSPTYLPGKQIGIAVCSPGKERLSMLATPFIPGKTYFISSCGYVITIREWTGICYFDQTSQPQKPICSMIIMNQPASVSINWYPVFLTLPEQMINRSIDFYELVFKQESM